MRSIPPIVVAPLAAALLALPPLSARSGQEPSPPAGQTPQPQDTAQLEAAFAAQGVQLSLDGRWCALAAEVCVREDLLEYLLVAPFGAAHESLFVTGVRPSVVKTALLALGAEDGVNAQLVERDPPPTPEELAEGASPYDVLLPQGTPFFLYAAWRDGDERFFFRVEDLIGNLRTGRSLERHAFAFLGSRMVRARPDAEEEVLAAELEGNLVNVSYITYSSSANTLVTAALEECVYQGIWIPNTFLVPPRGTPVRLVFSRQRLGALPEEIAEALAAAEEPAPGAEEEGAEGDGGDADR